MKTDADVIRAYPLREGKVWAQGERAASVCARLADEEEVEFVALKPCKDWLQELTVPEAMVRDGLSALQTVFWEVTPRDATAAVNCVERWLLERRPVFRGLLDSADELAQFASRSTPSSRSAESK